MKPRYVLHPGTVRSKSDGDKHFVGAGQLANLYRVNMSDCVVYSKGMRLDVPGDIHLYPRHGGNYLLPGIEFQPIAERKLI